MTQYTSRLVVKYLLQSILLTHAHEINLFMYGNAAYEEWSEARGCIVPKTFSLLS